MVSPMKNILSHFYIDPENPLPIYSQLGKQISWLIINGVLKEGDSLPSIRSFATNLNIHMHTVRLAYQRLEEGDWIKTYQGVGSIVLPFDPGKKIPKYSNPTNTIGVVLPDFSEFYAPVLKGLEVGANQLHALLLTTQTYDDFDLTLKKVIQLIAKDVDGLIIVSSPNLFLERFFAPEKIPPVVYVDSPDVGDDLYAILLDSYQAGYQATQHLIKHGHQDIGIVSCPLEWSNVEPCYRGYKDAFRNAGLPIMEDHLRIVPGFEVNLGYQAAQSFFQGKKRPTAIFAIADILAIGVMQFLKQHGKKIPQDCAVIGYNDIPSAALIEPALTTVSVPKYELGQKAISVLAQLIQKEEVLQKKVILKTQLVLRESCGCLYTS